MITQEQRDKVATLIMGWIKHNHIYEYDGDRHTIPSWCDNEGNIIIWYSDYRPDDHNSPTWQFTGVIEAMKRKEFSMSIKDFILTPLYGFQFWKTGDRKKYYYADTLPDAILLAALAAVEKSKETTK